jgi:hypothetical protein
MPRIQFEFEVPDISTPALVERRFGESQSHRSGNPEEQSLWVRTSQGVSINELTRQPHVLAKPATYFWEDHGRAHLLARERLLVAGYVAAKDHNELW